MVIHESVALLNRLSAVTKGFRGGSAAFTLWSEWKQLNVLVSRDRFMFFISL